MAETAADENTPREVPESISLGVCVWFLKESKTVLACIRSAGILEDDVE